MMHLLLGEAHWNGLQGLIVAKKIKKIKVRSNHQHANVPVQAHRSGWPKAAAIRTDPKMNLEFHCTN